MAAGSRACPADEQLAAFFSGELSGDRVAAVEEHVAHCDRCMQALDALESGTKATVPERPLGPDAPAAPGTRIGRYVVERIVGAGAMGTVYAAQDPELRRRVAVKVMKGRETERLVEARAERMRREARAMARLSHPNVMAVHDVGTHEGRAFVAMEFVRGGTMREWLAARPRRLGEILDVLVQAGRGLAAAHAAGLVHRDFKPDNVLVSDDGRVLVTDFGLARRAAPRDAGEAPESEADSLAPSRAPVSAMPPSATLTQAGAILGTPAYMAPEQLAGEQADARSDVFAFCVSAYVALYGERPFEGSGAQLKDAIETGRVRAPPRGARVPARLRRVILAGLRADPAARPASMQALLVEIERARGAPRRRAAWLGAALAAAGVAGAAALAWRGSKGPVAPEAAAPGVRPAFAVIAPPGDAATRETLAAALGAGGALRVMAAEEGVVGADYLVEVEAPGAGSGGRVRARVLRSLTGDAVASAESTGGPGDAPELVWRVALALRRELGLPATAAEVAAARAALPGGEAAWRAYGEGLEALGRADGLGAREALERAAAQDPAAPKVHLALAETLDLLGYDARAAAEAQRALDAAGPLAREDALLVETARAAIGRDLEKTAAGWRALTSLFPDRVAYAVRLLDVQRRHQDYAAAEETLAALRRLPAPLAHDARVDLAEASLALSRGDAGRAQAVSEVARARALAAGDGPTATRAMAEHAMARLRLGERSEAAGELLACALVAAAAGDEAEAAFAKERLAEVRADDCRLDEAATLLAEVLDADTRAGRQGRVTTVLVALGAVARRRGDDASARRFYEDALARDTARGAATREVAATQAALGSVLAEMGEPGAAREHDEAALALRREARSGAGESEALAELAELALLRGDAAEGRQLAETALARAIAAKAKSREASSRQVLAEALAESGENAAAREAFDAACESLRAEAPALEAGCRARFARALAGWGARADALRQIERAEQAARAPEAWLLRRQVAIDAARVRAAADPPGRAAQRAALEELAAQADRGGAVRDALEAALALGEVERADGRAEAARERLARVAREASARGLLGIARRATLAGAR